MDAEIYNRGMRWVDNQRQLIGYTVGVVFVGVGAVGDASNASPRIR